MAKVQNGDEILPKVPTPEQGTRTLQTTDEFAIAMTRTSRSHVRVIKFSPSSLRCWLLFILILIVFVQRVSHTSSSCPSLSTSIQLQLSVCRHNFHSHAVFIEAASCFLFIGSMQSGPSIVPLILFLGELVEWLQTRLLYSCSNQSAYLHYTMVWRHALCASHNSSPWICYQQCIEDYF